MKKMNKVKMVLTVGLMTSMLALSGCNWAENELGKMSEALKGREAVIQTYDEDSNVIDRMEGKSVSIKADPQFDLTDIDGMTTEKSSVIGLTVGGKQILHVGSSLILHEKGLTNYFEEYAKTVDVENFDRSTPFVNRMVNNFKNLTTGADKIILIRSQTGKPLATFAGKDVSYFATDIDKSTGLLIDGKYLLVYRCDYTIYDASLFD